MTEFKILSEPELREFAQDQPDVEERYFRGSGELLPEGEEPQGAEEILPLGEESDVYLGFAQIMAATIAAINGFTTALKDLFVEDNFRDLLDCVRLQAVHQIQAPLTWETRPILGIKRDRFTDRFRGWRQDGAQFTEGDEDPGEPVRLACEQIPDSGGWPDAHYAGVCVACYYAVRRILRDDVPEESKRPKAIAALKVAIARLDAARAAA